MLFIYSLCNVWPLFSAMKGKVNGKRRPLRVIINITGDTVVNVVYRLRTKAGKLANKIMLLDRLWFAFTGWNEYNSVPVRRQRQVKLLINQRRLLKSSSSKSIRYILSTILDRVKCNSKPPSTPNQGWSREKVKTRHFAILDLVGRGYKFSIYFVQDCSFLICQP